LENNFFEKIRSICADNFLIYAFMLAGNYIYFFDFTWIHALNVSVVLIWFVKLSEDISFSFLFFLLQKYELEKYLQNSGDFIICLFFNCAKRANEAKHGTVFFCKYVFPRVVIAKLPVCERHWYSSLYWLKRYIL